MAESRQRKRAGSWLLVVSALVVLAVLLVHKGPSWGETGAEWGQFVIQALAAIGGLWYAFYRSRPRVTLRLRMTNFIYLELANVGNRVAKEVQVRCDPPIPLPRVDKEDGFGPVEDFGDMDRDQVYVLPLDHPGPHIADILDKATFEVSHESTWWFGRRKSTIRFRGAGARRSIREDAPMAIGEIAKTVKAHGKELKKTRVAIEAMGRRLRPPADGGDDLDLKACAGCGWGRFTYNGSGQYAEFRCANCGMSHEDPDCECGVSWCEHRPAPRQCVRRY